jgi:hypothetical protein
MRSHPVGPDGLVRGPALARRARDPRQGPPRRWRTACALIVALLVLGLAPVGVTAGSLSAATRPPGDAPASQPAGGMDAAGLSTGETHCETVRGRLLCRHHDYPPPTVARRDRSLKKMVRDLGGRSALRHLRSNAAGAQVEVEGPEIGGISGPDELAGVAGANPSAGGGTPGMVCIGSGSTGRRIQAVYAYTGTNRSKQVVPMIRGWAADVSTTVAVSAKQSGARLNVRWVHTPDCVLSVMVIKVPARTVGDIYAWTSALGSKGLKRADRRYLVWMDANALCGIGSSWVDDSPGQSNINNGVGRFSGWSRVDRGCWGLFKPRGFSVEAHELFHNLGAVQSSAPHSTKAGHCNDEYDVMCYADGGRRSKMRYPCADESRESWLDCRRDDYFNPKPKAGTYLAKRWNTARSAFLDTGSGGPPYLYGVEPQIPSGGLDEPTATVPLKLSLVADFPITGIELAASRDGGPFLPLDLASGTPTEPVVVLERGVTWALSVTLIDAKGMRSSAWITAAFDLPRDGPPSVSGLMASVSDHLGDKAEVRLAWDESDDGWITDWQVQRAEGSGSWEDAGGETYGSSWYGVVARGKTWRFRVRVQDDRDQWSSWVETELSVPANKAPTVSKPSLTFLYDDDDFAWVEADWQADDDDGYVDAEEVWGSRNGGAEVRLEQAGYPGMWLYLERGSTWVIRVRAIDDAGAPTWSAPSSPLVLPGP